MIFSFQFIISKSYFVFCDYAGNKIAHFLFYVRTPPFKLKHKYKNQVNNLIVDKWCHKIIFKFFPFSGCQNRILWITYMKGKSNTAFADAKGGEKMEKPSSYERRVQNQFGAFCVKVLKNEARHIHRENKQCLVHEKSINELSNAELSELTVYDNYFENEHIFNVDGKDVIVSGDILAQALNNLPADKRDIILLSYFLGMTDREIGERLNTLRQTISKRRAGTLKNLREYLEKEEFEWPQKM